MSEAEKSIHSVKGNLDASVGKTFEFLNMYVDGSISIAEVKQHLQRTAATHPQVLEKYLESIGDVLTSNDLP
jgi:hypothetical protein